MGPQRSDATREGERSGSERSLGRPARVGLRRRWATAKIEERKRERSRPARPTRVSEGEGNGLRPIGPVGWIEGEQGMAFGLD